MQKKLIYFSEEDHKYSSKSDKYRSVTKFIDNFGFEFDAEYFSVRKALSNNIHNFWKIYFSKGFNFDDNIPNLDTLTNSFSKYIDDLPFGLDKAVEDVIWDWNQSSIKGTEFHKLRESEVINDGYGINPYDGKEYPYVPNPLLTDDIDNVSSMDYLKSLEDGIHVELLIFSEEYGIAGQSDEVFIETINGVRYVDIGDHKTNNKKPVKSEGNSFCVSPIAHIKSNKYHKYNLQTSLYGYMMELYGYKVRNVGFYHYENYDKNKKTTFIQKYLSSECLDILEFDRFNYKS